MVLLHLAVQPFHVIQALGDDGASRKVKIKAGLNAAQYLRNLMDAWLATFVELRFLMVPRL